MNFKFVIILLNIAVAVCSQRSHAHRSFQWDSYNTNTIKRIQSNDTSSSTTSSTTPIPVVNKVNLTVYYETLCPASVRFITNQLKPVVEIISSHLNVELVPYGHARTFRSGGSYVFRCQHGPEECYGNKLHACAVDALQNNTHAALFNACLMHYSAYGNFMVHTSSILNWCGHKLAAPIHGIWECINSERSSLLLRNYGVLTHSLRPRYVPYLVLDGTHDRRASGNLMWAICNKLKPAPPPCNYYT